MRADLLARGRYAVAALFKQASSAFDHPSYDPGLLFMELLNQCGVTLLAAKVVGELDDDKATPEAVGVVTGAG